MKKRVYSYLTILVILTVTILTGCKKDKAALPTLTTTAVTNITSITAKSGGDITNDGGAIITARGVCWSIAVDPTIADSKTSDSTGIGTFVSLVTGIKSVTTYYLRAYATNSAGTAYGNELTFMGAVSDIDGNFYDVVTIGTQVWLKDNLRTTRYSNGDIIGTTVPATLDISGESTPEYQWPSNGNEDNVPTYGRLYTWYAATDGRSVCPTGWHVPSDAEWTTLVTYLTDNGFGYQSSGDEVAMSLAATTNWTSDETAGNIGNDLSSNNTSGFTALPSGARTLTGSFYSFGDIGLWWTTTEYFAQYAWCRYLDYDGSNVYKSYNDEKNGWSIRCMQNY